MRQVSKKLSFAGLLPQWKCEYFCSLCWMVVTDGISRARVNLFDTRYFTLIREKVIHGHLQQQQKLSVSHEILRYSWYCLDVIVLWWIQSDLLWLDLTNSSVTWSGNITCLAGGTHQIWNIWKHRGHFHGKRVTKLLRLCGQLRAEGNFYWNWKQNMQVRSYTQ